LETDLAFECWISFAAMYDCTRDLRAAELYLNKNLGVE
jgi:hypothetical protein